MTHTPADAAIWAAQLADMPEDVVVAYLYERGYVVYPDTATHQLGPYRIGWLADHPLDRLPPGYPPRAEDDEPLPFEVGRDE